MCASTSDSNEIDVPTTFEAARNAQQHVVVTHDAYRLYWTLEGSLSTAIRVMDDKWYDPDKPLVPYCDQTGPSPKWHPVSQCPLTDPKVSSVTVHVEQLDDWEENWLECHSEHGENALLFENSGFSAHFGSLPDYDPNSDSDEEEHGHLLRCCGEDRPRKMKVSLVVKAREVFVTVHDYVSAVHPWLIGLRENILGAAGYFEEQLSLPANTMLMVCYAYAKPDLLIVYEEKEWQHHRSRERNEKLSKQIKDWELKKVLRGQEASEQE